MKTSSAHPPRFTAMQMIEQAIAEGRHSSEFRTVCEGCHEWVKGIFHVQLDGKRICYDCAAAQGVRLDPHANQKGV